MPDTWMLVTDVIRGRREVIGWARIGKSVKHEGDDLPEWVVLLLRVPICEEPITVNCGEAGWLPESPDDVVLDGAPFHEVRDCTMFEWQERKREEIFEAAERYRESRSNQN